RAVANTDPTLLTKFGIDDIDPNSGLHVDPNGKIQHNLDIDTQAAFGQINTNGDTVVFSVYDDTGVHAPLGLGDLLRGLGTTGFPLFVSDASGDDTPQTVFQKGALRVSYDFSNVTDSLTGVTLEALQNGSLVATLGTFTAAHTSNLLVNLDGLPTTL